VELPQRYWLCECQVRASVDVSRPDGAGHCLFRHWYSLLFYTTPKRRPYQDTLAVREKPEAPLGESNREGAGTCSLSRGLCSLSLGPRWHRHTPEAMRSKPSWKGEQGGIRGLFPVARSWGLGREGGRVPQGVCCRWKASE